MANNEGLLELNGKDIVQVIGEEAVPRTGDIDATTYNQKNYVISGSSYSITKDTPDVLYLELTGDFAFTCTGAENANRTIKVQIHKASTVSATTTITWNGVTEWLTDGNSAPVFGQVASTEQNLVIAICLSNTVVLANTLYNSENPVSGGAVTIAGVSGLQDALDGKLNIVNGSATDLSTNKLTFYNANGAYIDGVDGGKIKIVGELECNGLHISSADIVLGDESSDIATITGGKESTLISFSGSSFLYNQAQVATVNDVNTKIALSGSRGQLAGYEQCATVTSLTLTDTSADSNYYNSTSAITVNDGTTGMSWTKTVKLAQVPASVNMTGNWTWVGGSAPTMVANGLLVFTWQNNHGLINFLSPSA